MLPQRACFSHLHRDQALFPLVGLAVTVLVLVAATGLGCASPGRPLDVEPTCSGHDCPPEVPGWVRMATVGIHHFQRGIGGSRKLDPERFPVKGERGGSASVSEVDPGLRCAETTTAPTALGRAVRPSPQALSILQREGAQQAVRVRPIGLRQIHHDDGLLRRGLETSTIFATGLGFWSGPWAGLSTGTL